MQKIAGFVEAGNTTLTISGAAGTIAKKVQGSFPSATITVYLAGTVTVASIYSDDNSPPTAKANPFTADANGNWFFYVPNGNYDVKFSGAGISAPFTVGDFQAFDPINVVYADAIQFTGADFGAKVNNAIASIPSGGVVDARGLNGTQSSSSVIVVPANVVVLLNSNLITFTHPTAGFEVVGSASASTQNGGIHQEPGGIIKYTGAGAAILLSPGNENNFISGFTIDIDTIDCNAQGAYGIQCSGAGWVQRCFINFKRIWHFTNSGLDFQLGRKNGNMIYGVDIDGSNLAGTTELGIIGVNFEDSSAQAGYNLYEANHIEIATIRNTTSYPLRIDFNCGHNYFVIDCGNDYANTITPIYSGGSSNTVIIKGVNPWTDIAGAASTGGQQTRYPSIYLANNTLAGTNVFSIPSKLLGGIVDENLLGVGGNFLGPADQENFLLNSSFENVDGTYPIGWTPSSVTPAAITNQAKHGRLCLQTAVANATVGYIKQTLPSWMAGKTITACVWVKNSNTGGTSGVQAIAIFDNVGIGGFTENYIVKPNDNAQWNYLIVTKTIPGGAATMELRLYADRAGTNAGGQNVLWGGVGIYFGIQPSMPTTINNGAIGTTLLPKNVGIGTSAPNGPLDVNGSVWVTGAGNLVFNSNATILNNLAAQTLDITSGASGTLFLEANGGTVRVGTNVAVPMFLNAAIAPTVNNVTLANGANNNVNAANKSWIRITGPSAGFNITGFTGGVDGQLLYILNASGFQMTLTNNSGASTQKILSLTGADVVLRVGSSFATLQYDNNSGSWIVVATN